MSPVVPKGWCPGIYQPMRAGDGFLVRVKPPNAMLISEAARRLAAAAAHYGNAVIELTSRGRIQVRGLQQNTVEWFAEAMVVAGLADADPEIERRRAVVLAPLADAAVQSIGAEVESALCHDPSLALLPAKFTVVVDRNDDLSLGDIGADIYVAFDGPTLAVTLMATRTRLVVSPADVPATVTSLALTSLQHPMRRHPAPRTLRGVGWLSCGAFGLGLPFGATTAATLASLANLSETHGDGTLRVTPWRAFIIPQVTVAASEALREAGTALGMIVDPADPRLAVVACPGQPACSSATVPARADALWLAALGLPPTVHVSGCAKGCAHPGPARITLVGENGRYVIVRNGRPQDEPLVRNLTLEQVVATLQA